MYCLFCNETDTQVIGSHQSSVYQSFQDISAFQQEIDCLNQPSETSKTKVSLKQPYISAISLI